MTRSFYLCELISDDSRLGFRHRYNIAALEDIHRGQHTTTAMRNVGEIEAHFDTRKGSHQHQVVEMADMADPERLALELAQTGPERHVEIVEHHLAIGVGVVAIWHHDSGQRRRIPVRIQAD